MKTQSFNQVKTSKHIAQLAGLLTMSHRMTIHDLLLGDFMAAIVVHLQLCEPRI